MANEVVYLTTSEVAQLARVDASTVRRWVERGELKPAMQTPGGRYRFTLDAVHALLGIETAVEAVAS